MHLSLLLYLIFQVNLFFTSILIPPPIFVNTFVITKPNITVGIATVFQYGLMLLPNQKNIYNRTSTSMSPMRIHYNTSSPITNLKNRHFNKVMVVLLVMVVLVIRAVLMVMVVLVAMIIDKAVH